MKKRFLEFIKALVTVVGILVGAFLIPIVVEYIIKNGIFEIRFNNTIFTKSEWFAFWGSYLGAIITIIIFWLTIHYNKLEARRMMQCNEIDNKYDLLLGKLNEIHLYISLKNSMDEHIEDVHIIYLLRLSDKRMFALMNDCEHEVDDYCKEYISYVKQTFYEYLLEADKVPKSLVHTEMENAAQTYKRCTKEIISIMHRRSGEESRLYDVLIEKLQEARIEEKKGLRLF